MPVMHLLCGPGAARRAAKAWNRAALPCVALAAAALSGAAQADACQDRLPRALSDAAARAFPGLRAPLEFDNAPEDIQAQRSNGGDGCLGVGVGDFSGDGRKDYVLALTARKGGAGRAVVALARKGGWNFVELESWPAGRRVYEYVTVVSPGRYESHGGDSKGGLACENPGVEVGVVGGAATVYCLVQGRWLHAAVSH